MRPSLPRLLGACLLALMAAPAIAEPVPTVIVEISGLGPARVQALKQGPGVRWAAEFGTEMLLGVAPAALKDWQGRPGVRSGLGLLDRDEIWVRSHVCIHESQQPALGAVGGFEVLRMPPSVIRYAKRSGVNGSELPADGVVAQETGNSDGPKATMGATPEVQAVVDRIDAERWFQTMSLLAGFNRNTYSPALGSASDWILSAFEGAQLGTSVFEYNLTNISACPGSPAVNVDNPIGLKQGETLPDEWVVVGAHYDSRNFLRCDGTANPQPGANDNASGCAGVIELARAFAGVSTQRTVLFMCFSGEEQGLWGSRRYVEALQASGEIAKVKHMINLDMIGFDAGGTLDAQVVTSTTHSALQAQYVAAAATYAPELNIITSTGVTQNTDYWYFLQAGVPTMFTWENGVTGYVHYHESTDLPANMTNARPLAGGILKMDAAMLATIAGIGPLFADGFE